MRGFIMLLVLCCGSALSAQKILRLESGSASYVSSQNVYVKFSSTENIGKGDTLFQLLGSDAYKAALLVKDKSSTSCVCSSFLTEKVKVGDVFWAKCYVEEKKEKNKPSKTPDPVKISNDSTLKPTPLVVAPVPDEKDEVRPMPKQQIKGRFSAASYSNFNGEEATHRMRYTFTLQGNRLKGSRFSTDNYIAFRHTLGEWEETQSNINNALKIYALSVKYNFDKNSSLSLGRKINQRISSMGAIDGLQAEKGLGKFTLGAILGSRPDILDYSLNFNLMQAGAYLSYGAPGQQRRHETSFAFIEQRNAGKTDRRFAYFQHSNDLFKNLNVFTSGEMDLFESINGENSTKASLTNLLLSLRYRISKKLSINAAYDNRKNIIYYESYKNYIDQLIDDETRQGLRFGANYRIAKMIHWGMNAGWRFQKSNANLSKNLNSYLNFTRLPWINAMASLSVNLLQTNYLNSNMYSARLSREIVRGKLNAELYFRVVEYDYAYGENKLTQDIGGIDLSWTINRKLAFYLYYEGTFEKSKTTFNRINARIIQRF